MKLARRQKAVPKKHRHKQLQDPRNTHEKKFWNHEFPTSKTFGPTKYRREKTLEPQKPTSKNVRSPIYRRRHDGTIALDPRGHATHDI